MTTLGVITFGVVLLASALAINILAAAWVFTRRELGLNHWVVWFVSGLVVLALCLVVGVGIGFIPPSRML